MTSDDLDPRYLTGEAIHIGDQILHMGRPGQIVFVANRDEFSDEFPKAAWADKTTGFMVKDQFGLFVYDEADDCIEFISRATKRSQ